MERRMSSRRESGRSSVASTLPAEVRVCCRVRPRTSSTEGGVGVAVDGDVVSVEYHDQTKSAKSRQAFEFDTAFAEDVSQDIVFKTCCPSFVEDALAGINSSVIAYGQTGSGKTHSMLGSMEPDESVHEVRGAEKSACRHRHSPFAQSQAGVIPRLMHELFDSIASLEGCEVLVQLSLVEIYNERVHDLFHHVLGDTPAATAAAPGPLQGRAPPASPGAPSTPSHATSSRRQSRLGGVATPVESRTPAKRRASVGGKQPHTPRGRAGGAAAPSPALRLRQDSANGGGVFVEGAARVAVDCAASALALLGQGLAARAVGSTRMNADSSRSHCVLLCDIDVLDAQRGTRRSARMTLVDLAGSEAVRKTGARGVTLDEAKTINKSLSALGNVVNALTSGKEHIPYRDSKLTRLLQDSIGGNARTCMLITVSPHAAQAAETLSTLRFGQRAAHVRNKPTASVTRSLADYKALVEKLTADIDEYDGMVETLQKREQAQSDKTEQALAAAEHEREQGRALKAQLQEAQAKLTEAEKAPAAAAALQEELTQANAQIEVLEEQLQGAFERQEDAHAQACDAQERLDALEAEHAAAVCSSDALRVQLETVQGERDELSAALAAAQGERDELSAALATAQGERDELSAALAAAQGERDELSAALAAAQGERDELSAALAAAQGERDDAVALVADQAQGAQAAFAARLGDKEAQLGGLRNECTKLRDELAAKSAEADAAAGDASELRDQLAAKSAEADAAAQRAAAAEARVADLETELAKLRVQSDAAEQSAGDLASTEASLRGEVSDLRDELAALQQDLSETRAAHVTEVTTLQSNARDEISELKICLASAEAQVQGALGQERKAKAAHNTLRDVTEDLERANQHIEVLSAEYDELEQQSEQKAQQQAREAAAALEAERVRTAAAQATADAAQQEIVALKQQLRVQGVQLARAKGAAGDAALQQQSSATSTQALQEELSALKAALNEPKQALRKKLAAQLHKNTALEHIVCSAQADVQAQARAAKAEATAEVRAAQERIFELEAEVSSLRTARDIYRSDCRSIMSLVAQSAGGAVVSPLARRAIGRRHSEAPSPRGAADCSAAGTPPPRRAIPAGFSPFACHMQSPRAPTHVFEAARGTISTAGGAVDCGSIIASTGVGMQAPHTPTARRALAPSTSANSSPLRTPKTSRRGAPASVVLVSPSGLKSPYR